MERYLDPKNDLVFKKIFGEHKDLVKSILNALMPLGQNQRIEAVGYSPEEADESAIAQRLPIETLEYCSQELPPERAKGKNSLVDVYCVDNFGRRFLIEMQVYWTKAFFSRMVYNVSKVYSGQIVEGDRYGLLKPVYGLAIVNATFSRTPDFYHHYRITDAKDRTATISDMEFVLLELPKFKPETISERKMAALWLRFLRDTGLTKPVQEDLKDNGEILKAVNICERGAYTDAELAAYEAYWDKVRREKDFYSDGLSKGLAQGRVEGIEEGIAKGLEKGRVEGIEEAKAEMIRNGYKAGFSMEQLQTLSHYGSERITEIIKNIQSLF
jgi:predicted transposase/invertase (TIGR01784 family)